jgi:hypothetical protein
LMMPKCGLKSCFDSNLRHDFNQRMYGI